MKPHRNNQAVTLVELLVAVALLSVIMLAVTNIDIFSRFQLLSSERRMVVQNEAQYVLEHITKEVSKAIGSTVLPGQIPLRAQLVGTDNGLLVFVDLNGTGDGPGDGIWSTSGDRWRLYRYKNSSAPSADRYQLWYYTNYPTSGIEVIARKVSAFPIPAFDTATNSVNVSITTCWDPAATTSACGTSGNPSVTMNTTIKMPSVSTN